MKKYLLNFLIALIIPTVVPLTGCSGDDPEPEPEKLPDRTVLVYMIANNSLASYSDADISEMKSAAMNGDLADSRWLVYLHAIDGSRTLSELTSNGQLVQIKSYDSDLSSASAARMSEVITDAQRFAPAQDYGIILWSHASGWVVDGLDESSFIQQRSFGQDGSKTMNISTLAAVLKGRGFSFIYADCCNMSTVEVAYELREVADYLGGSATELPADGMPYNRTMKYFTSAKADVAGAAKETFSYYKTLKTNNPAEDIWCTLSVIDLKAIDNLASETAALYQKSAYPANYVPQTLNRPRKERLFFDFGHFADALGAGAEWSSALNKAVVYSDFLPYLSSGTKIESCSGLATYIQSQASDASTRGYKHTAWYRDVACYQPLP